MRITQIGKCGVALAIAVALSAATSVPTFAANKKGKHTATPKATHATTGASNTTQPALPDPPDPGHYQ
jgi:hypothetical protein